MLETMAPPVPKDINEGLQPVGMTSFNMEDKQTVSVEQPTAFILKLFEMINDAPDEVIAVSFRNSAVCIGYFVYRQFLEHTIRFAAGLLFRIYLFRV